MLAFNNMNQRTAKNNYLSTHLEFPVNDLGDTFNEHVLGDNPLGMIRK